MILKKMVRNDENSLDGGGCTKSALNKTLTQSIKKLSLESKKSKYIVMISYLQFLYLRYEALVNEVVSCLFSNDLGHYQHFMDAKLGLSLAECYRNKIVTLLKQCDYPCSFLEYQQNNLLWHKI